MKKLLIIGAGGHGNVVAETAKACGYSKIDFIDDNSDKSIGKICDLDKFKNEYNEAFVGIGNNVLRDEIINKLFELGYKVPALIHPSAYVSESATIHEGTIIEPKAIVNTNSIIERGCIISAGSIVDHDVTVGKACHINAGAIVKAGATVDDYTKLEVGEVILGYQSAIVRKDQIEK